MLGRTHFTVTSVQFLRRYYTKEAHGSYFDVVISGGGMIGQTMACALAKNPYFKKRNILLIESSPTKEYRTPELYSNRVSSIAPSTKDLLVQLGIWKNIRRYQEVKDMKVWGSFSNDYVHFTHDIVKPAFIVENDEIINSAVMENSSVPNLEIKYGNTISDVNLNCNKTPLLHEISLKDGTTYQTSLLIGADGANSVIRNALDVNYISWKYDQYGVVATVSLADDMENSTAWQKFLPDGPIALLPLKNDVSSLVWSVPSNKAKVLTELPEDAFVDALNQALTSEPIRDNFISNVSDASKSVLEFLRMNKHVVPLAPPYIVSMVSGSRASFPLGFGHSSDYIKPGVVLIGDSAHKVHPLAGQGVNIGFRDVRCLAEKLTRGIIDGRPLGHYKDLKNYETEAQRNNLPLLTAIDLFHRVYTSKNNLLRAFGDASFHIAECITPVKSIMKHLATN